MAPCFVPGGTHPHAMGKEEKMTFFVYMDGKGRVTGREVSAISETAEYMQGYCRTAGSFRTFRKDRVLEVLQNGDGIAARVALHAKENPLPRSGEPRKGRNAGDSEICFTGFKKADKDRLIAQAEGAGFLVRTGVTSRLGYLCYGYNAGPKKLERARFQGVLILDEQQAAKLFEDGEVPEGP